jgi:hypothetical protein
MYSNSIIFTLFARSLSDSFLQTFVKAIRSNKARCQGGNTMTASSRLARERFSLEEKALGGKAPMISLIDNHFQREDRSTGSSVVVEGGEETMNLSLEPYTRPGSVTQLIDNNLDNNVIFLCIVPYNSNGLTQFIHGMSY